MSMAFSFRSELATCRQQLIRDRWEDRLARKVLDEWEKHPAVESIWSAISPKLPAEYVAREFILDVLALRVRTKNLDRVVRGLGSVEAKALARNKRHLKNKHYHQAADEMKLLAEVRDGRERLLSRKKETAARKYFETGWREKFIELCGQPFHDVVADLTEIAFGGEVTAEAVRSTRRSQYGVRTRQTDRGIRTPK
jgi:hypothetical protein